MIFRPNILFVLYFLSELYLNASCVSLPFLFLMALVQIFLSSSKIFVVVSQQSLCLCNSFLKLSCQVFESKNQMILFT